MTWAVVPAAGSGSRFGAVLPKQYLEVDGEPLGVVVPSDEGYRFLAVRYAGRDAFVSLKR